MGEQAHRVKTDLREKAAKPSNAGGWSRWLWEEVQGKEKGQASRTPAMARGVEEGQWSGKKARRRGAEVNTVMAGREHGRPETWDRRMTTPHGWGGPCLDTFDDARGQWRKWRMEATLLRERGTGQ